MKLANVKGRAVLAVSETAGIDVDRASEGKFGPSMQSIYTDWPAFATWAASSTAVADVQFNLTDLGAPSDEPRQVFAVGLNYGAHAEESGFDKPTHLPPVFTKYVSSLTGPVTTVVLPKDGETDWEVELVVVIGRQASRITPEEVWAHVAGVTVGQDVSERITQHRPPAPQFGLGKSLPGFSPTGPFLVTVDDLDDPDDLRLGCSIDGEVVQDSRTGDLLFPVPELISKLSHTVTLLPGDLIFTGTPAGVGVGREPKRFLQPGEVLRSWITGIGELEQTFVAATPAK